jgi:hypothetical protein
MFTLGSDGTIKTTNVMYKGKRVQNISKIEFYQEKDALPELRIVITGLTDVSLKAKDDYGKEYIFTEGKVYPVDSDEEIDDVESIYFEADAANKECILRINKKEG